MMIWPGPLPPLRALQLSLRAAAAAVVALLVADLLALPFPIYAFIAGVIVTDLDPGVSRRLGARRIGATVIGAMCGAILTSALAGNTWGIGAGVLIAMLASQLLGAEEGARVAGYICGLILLEHSDAPWAYAFHRFVETVLGVISALVVSCVPKIFEGGRGTP